MCNYHILTHYHHYKKGEIRLCTHLKALDQAPPATALINEFMATVFSKRALLPRSIRTLRPRDHFSPSSSDLAI